MAPGKSRAPRSAAITPAEGAGVTSAEGPGPNAANGVELDLRELPPRLARFGLAASALASARSIDDEGTSATAPDPDPRRPSGIGRARRGVAKEVRGL